MTVFFAVSVIMPSTIDITTLDVDQVIAHFELNEAGATLFRERAHRYRDYRIWGKDYRGKTIWFANPRRIIILEII
ncbi:hypothetical protein BC937DRAFT_89593 [Endogone sp. FLAS-F59071]|nr:hypothetical protein BC937DRAFT_89593 [Endogone sp. FLAS-F59071]|eukprot:RUS17708.1 hypothetical protein BC937DRAFT_89593 [Endogone sp. FLAS-F59071]